jgi:hypothetical protein
MVSIFHGNDAETHRNYQAWRKANVDGFSMSEGDPRQFTIHYAQDKRENPAGRGCMHTGGSDIGYLEDKNRCYTTARKVCSDSFAELIAWHQSMVSPLRTADTATQRDSRFQPTFFRVLGVCQRLQSR